MSDWKCAATQEHRGEVLVDLSEERGCGEEEGDVLGGMRCPEALMLKERLLHHDETFHYTERAKVKMLEVDPCLEEYDGLPRCRRDVCFVL